MRKQRSDSMDSRLTPQSREVLERWLFVDKLSYTECQARLRAEFSVSCSLGALQNWYQHKAQDRLLDRIASGRHLAEAIDRDLRASAPALEDSAFNLLSQLAFQLATGDTPNIKDLTHLLQTLIKRKEWELDRDKFEHLRRRADMADQAQRVVESKLSPEETQSRMKEIFGLA
jgi:hypothetical protein